ncbi:MAG: sugar ABC transporter permease [Chloroflexi bacterium]|nr:sugar ABC transporter permease [Chloroflexota bacterium]
MSKSDPKQKRSSSITRQKRLNVLVSSLVALLGMGFALFPFPWIISAALDPLNVLSMQTFLPKRIALDNFISLFTDPTRPYLQWLFNSLKISSVTAILVVFITSLGAYAFSRFRFPGRRGLMFSLLLVQVYPNILAMIALFIIVWQIGRYIPGLGLDTHGGLIMVYLGGAMGGNIWLMKGFFDTVPKELDESAWIDGASHWQVYIHIILPLIRPILTVIGILTFIGVYGDYLIARILLTSADKLTLAVGMQGLINLNYNVVWGQFSAGAILGALPILIIFYSTQKLIVSGLTQGAVKG